MLILIYVIFGISGATTPTSHDAFNAYTDRMLEAVRESGDAIREHEIMMGNNFPSSVILENCEFRSSVSLQRADHSYQNQSGFECIQTVTRNGAGSYRTSGFYYHDGLDWRYYGPVQEIVIPLSPISKTKQTTDLTILKPGATYYERVSRGRAQFFNDPYSDLIDEEELTDFSKFKIRY